MDGVKPRGGRLARSGARRQARSRRHARLPHVDELPLFRHRAADRDLVREERPQHLRHASLHPSAVDGGGSGLGIAQRLGDLQDHRKALLGARRRPSRRRARRGADADPARHCRPSSRNLSRSRTGRRANANSSPASPRRRSRWSSATIPTPIAASRRSGRSPTSSAMAARASPGTPRTRSKGLGDLNYRGERRRADRRAAAHRDRHRRRGSHPLSGAGNQWRGRGQGLGGARQDHRPRPHASRRRCARTRRSAFAIIQAQPRKIISSPTWSGIESEHVSYTAGYTNVNELIPWRTLTRSPAILPGPPLVPRFRRKPRGLPAADRYAHRRRDARQTQQRRSRRSSSTSSRRTRNGASIRPIPTIC